MKNLPKYQKRGLLLIGLLVLLFVVINLQLPYYLYKPGSADNVHGMVQVENRTLSEGDYHLVTISGRQANMVDIISAFFLPYYEIENLNKIHPENMTDDEYWAYQLQMMQNSQNAATIVAYHSANEFVEVKHNGIFVGQIVESMPAEDVLKVGDIINKVDNETVKTPQELMQYINNLSQGDEVKITFEREGQVKEKIVELATFPGNSEKVGLGIVLMANDNVKESPEVTFESGDIGGPSAGLMFTLEIYDQLLKEDISKGYHIAGTGEIDNEGNVHRIGGVDKKVVAADKAGMDIFFAPAETKHGKSNYDVAKQTGKSIDTDMQIVPVNHFDDAVKYLEELDEK